MIAILADPDDRLASLTYEHLRRQGRRVDLLEAATLLRTAGLSWSLSPPGGFLDLGPSVLELEALHSVLARTRPGGFDTEADDDETYSVVEAQAAMLALLAGLPALVVNRPRPLDAHRPILIRPQAATDCGLRLAPTLVTSEAEAASHFYREVCRERAMVGTAGAADPGAAGDGPPLVAVSGSGGAQELAPRVEHGPVAIQALPAGRRLTVLVAGDQCSTGARGEDGLLHPADLDGAIGLACVRLARSMELSFAGVDLVLDRAEATCLDVTGFPDTDQCSEDLEDMVVSALGLLLESAGER